MHFRRPKTLRLPRNPKYERKAFPARNKLDNHAIIKLPYCTEPAMKLIEDANTLTFLVDLKANKRNIRLAVEKLYNVKVVNVNTLIR